MHMHTGLLVNNLVLVGWDPLCGVPTRGQSGHLHWRRPATGAAWQKAWGQRKGSTEEQVGEGSGNPLQCSCLENPRDGGAWWAAVYGVAQSWIQLKRLSRSRGNPKVDFYLLPPHLFSIFLHILVYFHLLFYFVHPVLIFYKQVCFSASFI